MLSRLVVRAFELLLVVLAAYTVVCVPVGRRTLFEHALAIFSTEPAHEAAADVRAAANDAKGRALGALDAARDAGARALVPAGGSPGARPR